jgi:hypothetical protein
MKGDIQVKLTLLGALLYCLSFSVSRYYLDHKFPPADHRMAYRQTPKVKTPVAYVITKVIPARTVSLVAE